MCIYVCQKWLCTFKTCKDLYHKPHEEDSPIKRKVKLEMFNVMWFFKIREIFPLLYENYAYNNHKDQIRSVQPQSLGT